MAFQRKKINTEYEGREKVSKQLRLFLPIACALGIIIIGLIAELRKEPIVGETMDETGHMLEHPPAPGNWYIYIGLILLIVFVFVYFHERKKDAG